MTPSDRCSTSTPRARALQQALLHRHESLRERGRPIGGPGLVAAIVDRFGVDAAFVGQSRLDPVRSIDTQSLFHVASLSKQFTALVTMLLRDDGLIDLDEPLLQLVAGLPLSDARVTARHLLTHTSGIRDQWPLLEWSGWHECDPINTDRVLRLLARQRDVQFTPGSQFSYCNSGYTVLAEAIARLSGRPFSAVVQERVLRPLGMHRTHVADDLAGLDPERAHAYELAHEGHWTDATPHMCVAGPTSLMTCMDDYSHWMRAHMPGSPWSSLLREMQEPHVLRDGRKLRYGLGYFLEPGSDRDPRHDVVLHTGNDGGFSAIFAYLRHEETAVAVFSNASQTSLRPVADLVASCGAGPYGGSLRRRHEEVVSSTLQEAIAPEALTGFYSSPRGEVHQVRVGAAGQFQAVCGQARSLARVGPLRWMSVERGETYTFELAGGEVSRIIYEAVAVTEELLPIQALQTVDAVSHEGVYISDEVGATLHVTSEPWGSSMRLGEEDPIRMIRVDDALCWSDEMWVRFEDGDALVSTPRCVDVRFRGAGRHAL